MRSVGSEIDAHTHLDPDMALDVWPSRMTLDDLVRFHGLAVLFRVRESALGAGTHASPAAALVAAVMHGDRTHAVNNAGRDLSLLGELFCATPGPVVRPSGTDIDACEVFLMTSARATTDPVGLKESQSFALWVIAAVVLDVLVETAALASNRTLAEQRIA